MMEAWDKGDRSIVPMFMFFDWDNGPVPFVPGPVCPLLEVLATFSYTKGVERIVGNKTLYPFLISFGILP